MLFKNTENNIDNYHENSYKNFPNFFFQIERNKNSGMCELKWPKSLIYNVYITDETLKIPITNPFTQTIKPECILIEKKSEY